MLWSTMVLYYNIYVWYLFGLMIVIQSETTQSVPKNKSLSWPDYFHIRATRNSLSSNFSEDYEMWKVSIDSRIDCNKGQTKSIVRTTKTKIYGIKYEIRPAETRESRVKLKCHIAEGNPDFLMSAETILPTTSLFKYDGEEIIKGKNYTKFTKHLAQNQAISYETIWVVYKQNTSIPIRYEIIVNNVRSKSIERHEIWDYFDYSKKFRFRSVFGVSLYNCKYKALFDMSNEYVTKHLNFIDLENEKHVDHVFNTFIRKYNKNYSNTSDSEYAMRRSIFKNNMWLIKENNRLNTGYKLSINQFTDKLPQELVKHNTLFKQPTGKIGSMPFPYTGENFIIASTFLPREYDARLFGLVFNVKDQQSCGSWAFATVAAVEGALARINGGKNIKLSHQALIDCGKLIDAYVGCDNGTETVAYKWMMEYGLPTITEYGPYLNKDDKCRIKNMTTVYPIRGFINVTPYSVQASKVALVYHGPLSVSVNMGPNVQLYSSGILYDTQCFESELYHGMALVGYGETDGDTYWILKNSWGPTWGVNGYIYISARNNNCVVIGEPTYVVF